MVARPNAGKLELGQPSGLGSRAAIWLIAAALVLPLIAAVAPHGFRLGVTDIAPSVLSLMEQPLSARSPIADWALALVSVWFARWLRGGRWWEAAVVIIASGVILARTGNAWVSAVLLLPPLAKQLGTMPWKWTPPIAAATVLAGLGASLALALLQRPLPLAHQAVAVARQTQSSGSTLAHWSWAPGLRADLGAGRPVLPEGGLEDQPGDVWFDYLRVAQGHERWSSILAGWHVDVVVLDAAEQEAKAAALIRESPDWRVLYDQDGALVAELVAR